MRATRRGGVRAGLAAMAAASCLFVAPPAAATAAVFFPRGSDAKVERHNLVVALGASGSVTWDAIDVSGSPSDIGLLVALKQGGQLEVTARAWVEAVDEATRVVVAPMAAGVECKALTGGVPGGPAGGDAGATGSANVNASGSAAAEGKGGCSGSGTGDGARVDGGGSGGGCLTSSESESGGCTSCSKSNGGGCGGCEPSSSGHPGCSAIHETAAGCAPASSSEAGVPPTSSEGGPAPGSTVGPYETVRVRVADGSARRWIDEAHYDVPASFDAAAADLESRGWELYAIHARSPAPASLVRSFRIATTSADATVPLRMLRLSTGADAFPTPVTLMTLASSPQALAGQAVTTIDESRLASVGSSSNYESLVASALGAPPASDAGTDAGGDPGDGGAATDGGAPLANRWVFESSRSLTPHPNDDAGPGGGPNATLGTIFQSKCGAKRPEGHVVCSALSTTVPADGGEVDAGAPDGGPAADAGAPSPTDASADATSTSDAAVAAFDAGADCSESPHESCDDIDLALEGTSAVASRFRGVISGDARGVADLVFVAAEGPLREARYVVRPTGEPGTCEPSPAGSSAGASAEASASCAATASALRLDAGPLVMLLGVLYALRQIMRRVRAR